MTTNQAQPGPQQPTDPVQFISTMFGHLLAPVTQEGMNSAVNLVHTGLNAAQQLWLGFALQFNRLYELRRVSALLEVQTSTMAQGFTNGYGNQAKLLEAIREHTAATKELTQAVREMDKRDARDSKRRNDLLRLMRKEVDNMADQVDRLADSAARFEREDDPDSEPPEDVDDEPSDDQVVWDDDDDEDDPPPPGTVSGPPEDDQVDDPEPPPPKPKARPSDAAFSHPVQ